MKTLDILRTASANLKRSKLRTFLTIIAIFIGALTLTLTNGIGSGVSSYIDKQLGNIGADDVLIIQQEQEVSGSSDEPQKYDSNHAATSNSAGFAIKQLTKDDIEAIEATQGILSVEPRIFAAPEYINMGGEKFSVKISSYIEGTRLDLAAGKAIDVDGGKNEIIVPVTYLEKFGFGNSQEALGEKVSFGIKSPLGLGEITEVEATIVGVLQKSLLSNGGIMVSRSLMEDMHAIQTEGLPPSSTERYVAAIARFDPNASEENVTQIKDRLKEKKYEAMTVKDTIGIIKDVINAIMNVLNAFAAIALLAASFGIINTLLMAVQERTKEIGLMKAMGMSSIKIFLLFSTEAVLLGFWGSLLGVVVANIIGQIANRVAADSFLKDLPGFDLLAFPITSMLMIIGIIMLVAFIAGTMPARRAAKQNPIDALRYE